MHACYQHRYPQAGEHDSKMSFQVVSVLHVLKVIIPVASASSLEVVVFPVPGVPVIRTLAQVRSFLFLSMTPQCQ